MGSGGGEGGRMGGVGVEVGEGAMMGVGWRRGAGGGAGEGGVGEGGVGFILDVLFRSRKWKKK